MKTAAKIKRHPRRTYFRVYDNQTGRYMCSGYNCRSIADLKKSMLSYFSIDHNAAELKQIGRDIVNYLESSGFTVECQERFRPFPKSHVYN